MLLCQVEKKGFAPFQEGLNAAVQQIKNDRILDRINNHDHTVWHPEPDEITNRLGWLDIANRMIPEISKINRFVEDVKADGFTQVLLLGMGGSSLAPELFTKTFGPHTDGLDLRVLDSTDPAMVLSCRDWIQPEKTLFIVSTKSGSTVETYSFFKYFYTWMQSLMNDDVGRHFIGITDPGSRLETIGNDLKFRNVFLNDPNIGGRFSALSHFGLIPAALVGVDLKILLKNAIEADWDLAAEIGVLLGYLTMTGRDKLTFILSHELQSYGDWAEQLIAESTGKNGRGILPVIGEMLLDADQYGGDRFFIHLKMHGNNTSDSRISDLAQAGHPVFCLTLKDIYELGEQFFIWELATAVCGHLLKINPFDQPNVESAKKAAQNMTRNYLEHGALPQSETALFTRESLIQFLNQKEKGDYIAIQVYLPMTTEIVDQIHIIQAAIQAHTNLAVTSGFGPRFLHSTGQLHKGDSGNGLFIQLTCDARQDVAIPNKPGSKDSDLSFQILKTAQAMGDYQALKNEKRRVIHFHFDNDVHQALNKLHDMIIQ
ncbi:glucose-6-phosphate isomerase [bacterium]|nr:glucose-6-phosphate isomerase [bacterium]